MSRSIRRLIAAVPAPLRRPGLPALAALLATLGTMVVALGALGALDAPRSASGSPSFTYDRQWSLLELQRHIDAGEVVAVTVDPDAFAPGGVLVAKTADGQLVPVELAVAPGKAASALAALGYDELLTREARAAVTAPRSGAAQPSETIRSLLGSIFPLLLAGLLLAGLVRFSGRSFGSFGERRSVFNTVMPSERAAAASGVAASSKGNRRSDREAGESLVRLDQVAGCEEAKLELTEAIEFLRDPARFRQLGARIPRGILLYGPPGTGKTMLAKAVAAEAGVPFHYASGSEFVEKYVGVGARRMRDLFAQAKKLGRGVIFFDEFDALGRARGGPNSHE